MPAYRVIRRGFASRRVWPFLAGAVLLLGLSALVPGEEPLLERGLPLLVAAAVLAAFGIVGMRLPLVVLEQDRFSVRGEIRPDGLAPVYAAQSGSPGGMPGFQSIEGSYDSRAPLDVPWSASIPRDLVTGAAVLNGRLVVTLQGRKGRSIPLRGVSAADREALLAWFGVPGA